MQNLVVAHTLELDFMDKTPWPRGEWDNEPDKILWEDTETGLPCLALRGPVGSFNGYVGIPVYHPAYGLSYNGETKYDHDKYLDAYWEQIRKLSPSKNILNAVDFDKLPPKPVVPNIGEKLKDIKVHGRLTFAGPSAAASKESWNSEQRTIDYHTSQARNFPKGDSAEWLKEWGPIIHDYEAWSKRFKAQHVCLNNDEVDETWWFGFDCAHSGDLSPKLEALKIVHNLSPRRASPIFGADVYRNLDYVRGECTSLARQLKALA
jgi:hypothetical protein